MGRIDLRSGSLIVLIVAIFLLAAPVDSAAQRHRHRRKHSHVNAGRAGSLQSKLEDVRAQKARLKKQLSETRHKARAVLGDIRSLDGKLSDVQDALEQTSTRLDQGRSEQQRLALELVFSTKKLEDDRVLVRRRLKAIYMRGQGSFLTVLVGASNVGDVATRTYMMQRIAQKDHALFEHFQALQKQVSERKREQDATVRRVALLDRQQKSQENELEGVRQEKSDDLDDLRAKQGQLQQMVAQFEADENEIQAQIEAFARRNAKPGGSPLPAFTGRLSRPVDAAITSGFGMRYHPILHITRLHAGIDFGARAGTPVRVAADGIVISATYMRGFGNVVIVDHGGGLSTVYAHLSRIFCNAGQHVNRGDHIGAVGSTGLATGPHLHFEVHLRGRAVNPLRHL